MEKIENEIAYAVVLDRTCYDEMCKEISKLSEEDYELLVDLVINNYKTFNYGNYPLNFNNFQNKIIKDGEYNTIQELKKKYGFKTLAKSYNYFVMYCTRRFSELNHSVFNRIENENNVQFKLVDVV